ncbi:P-loop containing nucleoside triphosphate hydrolase protein [Chytriomyces cf. hyalinus JEL632]|nr:P-loop containing nucleoside triphosphate hydrolase protein [Chytriomyces cf. hyalinus JEL632]
MCAVETFSPIAEQAIDFLTAIAEPVSRPALMHEYLLTEYSLYAAVSVGIQADSIISVLGKLCKTDLPVRLMDFIRLHTRSYGKVKLVLKDNHQYVESAFPDVLRTLLQDNTIRDARIVVASEDQNADELNTRMQTFEPVNFARPVSAAAGKRGGKGAQEPSHAIAPAYVSSFSSNNNPQARKSSIDAQQLVKQNPQTPSQPPATENEFIDLFDDDNDPFDMHDDPFATFEIAREKSEHVRKACSTAGYPILEEYDFRNDSMLPTFDLVLKPAAILRPYQEKSLNKMFGNGRARSGIIVLPCGAGKTLVGVTAACTVKKRVLVLCTSAVSVEQWAREFKSWTNLKEGEVAKFTSQHKELLTNDNGVLISTYTMVTFSSKRAYDAQKMMDYICSREWGLLILDEVHVVPADMFKKVLTIVAAHCKLGLTATLVREDDKIANLNYLIGPKLYEANWMDLAKKGHIANVKCSEVWCTMTREFYKEYLDQSSRKRQLLYVMNPNKIQACQYLIDFHEQRGDKVIVFSDNVFALKHYATKLNRPYIYGGSSTADRLRTLQQFKYNPAVNTIFLSKVGDTSIDIPEASCLIQISSHYGSRRQEAQRLGRILRAKKNSTGNSATDGYNSFFYTLVSRDTEEVFYCSKRQQFLIDQGYSYDIITRMEGMETVAPLVYSTLNQRLELLATILVSNDMVDLREIEEDGDEDALALFGITREDALDGDGSGTKRRRSSGLSSGGAVVQSVTSMKSLSGADNMAYIEQNRGGLGNEFRRKKK